MPDLARCIERHSLDPVCHVERRARTFLRNDRPTNTLAFLINLTYGIKRTFKHTHRDEKGIQDPAPDSRSRKRELPDFAMLMIEAVRSLGMAARFVSGYLHIPDDGGDGHVGAGNTHARTGVCRD
jgi:hypothetical protein